MYKRLIYLICFVLVMGLSTSVQADLIHLYTFNYGDARDEVGTADGILMNGATVNYDLGEMLAYVPLDGADDFVDLVGPNIAINTLTDGFTLKLWFKQPEGDQGYSMTAAFGDTQDWFGKRYVAICTTRGDQVSRAMITGDNDNPGYQSELAVNGPELYDDVLHLYSLVIGPAPCCDQEGLYISYYIDDQLMGVTKLWDGRQISLLSNTYAYLGKGLYPGDATVLGDLVQFEIYDEALSCCDIKLNYQKGPVPVPEPMTIALLGLGSLVLLRRRKS
jgi:hypothetical protein